MPETTEQVRALLRSRLVEIQAEAETLERALTSLRAPSRHGRHAVSPPRRPPAPARKRRSRRAARGERQAQLLVALEKSPGATAAELAGAIGVAPSQASVLIAKAKSQKLIVRQGSGYAPKAA
jgi:MarR family